MSYLVGTDTIIQKRGAKVGLITTKGHEDAIHIMRGSRGYSGRDIRKVVHFPETSKPAPIVPKRFIRGVSERVDCFGDVVSPLNLAETEAAILDLVAQGVEAIAVCFLWSFRNAQHETQVKELVQRLAPSVFVTCSIEQVTKTDGARRCTSSFTWVSCWAFLNDQRKQTAMASTPCATRSKIAASVSAKLSGETTSPKQSTRSETPRMNRFGTIGAGFDVSGKCTTLRISRPL